jgi:hypothetical protein
MSVSTRLDPPFRHKQNNSLQLVSLNGTLYPLTLHEHVRAGPAPPIPGAHISVQVQQLRLSPFLTLHPPRASASGKRSAPRSAGCKVRITKY